MQWSPWTVQLNLCHQTGENCCQWTVTLGLSYPRCTLSLLHPGTLLHQKSPLKLFGEFLFVTKNLMLRIFLRWNWSNFFSSAAPRLRSSPPASAKTNTSPLTHLNPWKGAQVLLYNMNSIQTHSKKFLPKWKGPFIVAEALPYNNYRLVDLKITWFSSL